jgi:urea carboxylase
VLERVLVANRGEIAGRIIRTLRRLGIESVAVYSDADADALHVRAADVAVRLGPAPAADSYLRGDLIVEAALATGAQAVHPGYGFLSEQADFARLVEGAELAFVGPTPAQLEAFGSKHTARDLASAAGVPLLAGSGLLETVDEAVEVADSIGYPVILKATAGGGGIGMRICADATALRRAFDDARRHAQAAFAHDGVFVERYLPAARHVEIQVFGDGAGRVAVLGDRDCSLQRRHQKVVEEAPAPGLPDAVRARLHDAARALTASVDYRSAGTVEMLVDVEADVVAFLEVNARLQVEHPVTEEVTGIDLVEWMVRLAADDPALGPELGDRAPTGHAIEARVYAEDAGADYRPSAGLITNVELPTDARVDGWVEAGTEVTASYDPMLAKVIVHGDDRAAAVAKLDRALTELRIDGVTTNVDLLRAIAADDAFRSGAISTRTLTTITPTAQTFEVLAGGTMTTVQDWPGRLGLWPVGVPPCGPMDDHSFRKGNVLLGNPEGAAGLELTATGPTLRFRSDAVVCIAGAPTVAELDDVPVPMWTPVPVSEGATLRIGAIGPPGIRAFVLVRGGIDVPEVLGSRSTFTLGGFGGHAGRALRPGDVVAFGAEPDAPFASGPLPVADQPAIVDAWELGVLEGPHGAPEFLTAPGVTALLDAEYRVHHNSARTGIRLVGPAPEWARADGGEAGLHPSNIHDTAYAVGAVDLTGDMPILLGPDGPSLGGFVCPAVVASGERWKLGQLRPGDTVRLVPVTDDVARDRRAHPETQRAHRSALPPVRDAAGGVLDRWEPDGDRPAVCWRRSGDEYLLVEYGPMTLDLALRFRVQALQTWIEEQRLDGVIEATAGIRSLQVHVDPDRLAVTDALAILRAAESELPRTADAEVESRVVHLPLSWDDPATRLAIERYMSTVRDDAPWCPWNIEFIRRVNGLEDVDAVHRIVFDAAYTVLGLGDVYLGAPVATPLDPRHRLVTTKYNPARTWTPENAVGIGGAYLCVYGMEGPGGYQFVGRTVQMWNRFHRTREFDQPWLLRTFDQIRFFPVSADELLEWRRALPLGRAELDITPTRLRLADHLAFLDANAESIAAFRAHQQAAFSAERERWAASGELDRVAVEDDAAPADALDLDGASVVESALHASVWQVVVEPGQSVSAGEVLLVLEAMKMETPVTAPAAGTVHSVLVRSGQTVQPGQALVALA